MKIHKKHTIKKHDVHSLTKVSRHSYHKLIHKVHYKHKISYKTIFYMKEYGPHSHVSRVIIKESLKILILASILSSLGGVHLMSIQGNLISILPLLILLPALNGMIGGFGSIISSKFTSMLYLGTVKNDWRHSKDVKDLLMTVLAVALISGVYISVLALTMAIAKGFAFSFIIAVKVLTVTLISVVILIGIISIVSIVAGLYVFHKNEDPNNFLIPIATSVADFGSMIIFVFLVGLLF